MNLGIAYILMKKIKKHGVKCWLVNTGWAGKPYGEGDRIRIAYSRAIVKHILTGDLDQTETVIDPLFKFAVPMACEGVPSEILNPRTAAPDRKQYDERARKLSDDFKKNFKQFEGEVTKDILDSSTD